VTSSISTSFIFNKNMEGTHGILFFILNSMYVYDVYFSTGT